MIDPLRRPAPGLVLAAALALLAIDASASPKPQGSTDTHDVAGATSDEATSDADVLRALPHLTSPLDRAPKLFTFKLADADAPLSLLRAYLDAEVERPGPYNRYVGGAYGRWSKDPWLDLAWGEEDRAADGDGDGSPEDGGSSDTGELPSRQSPLRLTSSGRFRSISDAPSLAQSTLLLTLEGSDPDASRFGAAPPAPDPLRVRINSNDWITRLFVADDRAPFWTTGPSLASNGYGGLWASSAKPVTDWRCRRRPVLFIRYGGENDRFSLVQCSGAVELGAVDRLSILARPPEVPDPGELPDEPDPDAWEKSLEWLPRVKLVNPRLLWLMQKIADAFPHRAVYVYSGYRPHKDKSVLQGHHSMHGDGRAMDIQVHGVRNEALFNFCRKLDDVGCGYYPNSKFVHVDVRRPGTGHAFWIDTSGPGEPSRYVDAWPGVVEQGALVWMQVPGREALPQGQRPRTPDERGTADVIRK